MQVDGGGGVNQEFPLAFRWAHSRTLRFADGPDDVHRRQRERERAFEVYRTLVDLLDAEWSTDAAKAVTIDLWFVDAYWKVGTLHIDRAEWERAAFEISRALAGGFMWEPLAVDQALSYLMRAYDQMDRHDVARYYAERALEQNPKNPLARRYLDPLSRDSK